MMKRFKEWIKKLLVPVGKWFRKLGSKLHGPWQRFRNFLKKVFDPISRRYQKLSNKKKKIIQGYLYIMPWIVGLVIFGVYQVAQSFRLSMADSHKPVFNPDTLERRMVTEGFGLKQYIAIFKNNPAHVDTIVSTLADIALVVPLVIIFALILALLLNRKIKGIGIFKTIFFIPVILLSGSLLGYFNDYGLLTMPSIAYGKISESITYFFPGFISTIILGAFGKIILILWLSGVQTLIFLIALQKNDKAIYEAAAIDGASGWDIFWKVTLPSVFPIMIINIIYTTVLYANLSNNRLIALINECVSSAQFGRPYASALAWILFLIEVGVIGFYTLIIRLSSKKYR
jgi:ABC-type sugar transport system permease subunit